MSLLKEIVVGSIEIVEGLRMQVREDTVIIEDSIELSRTYMRYVLDPGDDVSTRPQLVKDVANFLWTAQVVADWKLKHPVIPPAGTV
jgi:hypothetical protein